MLTRTLIEKLWPVYNRTSTQPQFIAAAKHDFNVPENEARIVWAAFDIAYDRLTHKDWDGNGN